MNYSLIFMLGILLSGNAFAAENDVIFQDYKAEFCPQIFKHKDKQKQDCLNSTSFSELTKWVDVEAEKCVAKRNPPAGTQEVLNATIDCNFSNGVYQVHWSSKAFFSAAKSTCDKNSSEISKPTAK